MNNFTKLVYLARNRSCSSAKTLLEDSKYVVSMPRKISFIQGIRPKPFNEKRYMQEDKIPEGYTIIYRAPMEWYIRACKLVSTFTTTGLGGVILYKYVAKKNLLPIYNVEYYSLIANESDLLYFGAGLILITIALRLVLSKYPLRIYRNQEKYIAIFQGQIPFSKSRKDFQKGEVSNVRLNPFNPWRDSMYKMKNTNVLLLMDYFKTPADFNEMFAEQK